MRENYVDRITEPYIDYSYEDLVKNLHNLKLDAFILII
jgi:hypothetical protein